MSKIKMLEAASEAEKMAKDGPQVCREFWRRLAGSLRKAAAMLD